MTDTTGIHRDAPVRVLVLWNQYEDASDEPDVTRNPPGRRQQVQAVVDGLRARGSSVLALDIEDDIGRLRDALTVIRPQLVFNLIDHYHGDTTQQAAIAGLFELHAAAFVGSSAVCLATCQDRVRARVALAYAELPTPGFRIVRDSNAIPGTDGMRAPMIVTQAFDDVYLTEGQTRPLADRQQVLDQCTQLFPEYELPFLIEEYVAARRVHALVLGNRVLDVLPLVEWADDRDAWRLAQLEPDLLGRVRDLARRAFRALDCRDFAQIDIHLDEGEQPYIIDVRPMIDMGEGTPLWAAAGFTDRGPQRVLAELLAYAQERALSAQTSA